jgi:hypothetical protein
LHTTQSPLQPASQQTPSVQKPLAQSVFSPQASAMACRQVPEPSHTQLLAAQPMPPPVHCGAGETSTLLMPTTSHTPLALPVSAAKHESQTPAQALLQQRPSTQWPLEHWLSTRHAPLSGSRAVQALPAQYWLAGAAQWSVE